MLDCSLDKKKISCRHLWPWNIVMNNLYFLIVFLLIMCLVV